MIYIWALNYVDWTGNVRCYVYCIEDAASRWPYCVNLSRETHVGSGNVPALPPFLDTSGILFSIGAERQQWKTLLR